MERIKNKRGVIWTVFTLGFFFFVLANYYQNQTEQKNWSQYVVTHNCRVIYDRAPTAITVRKEPTGEQFPKVIPGERIYQCDDGKIHDRPY